MMLKVQRRGHNQTIYLGMSIKKAYGARGFSAMLAQGARLKAQGKREEIVI
jgi:hypothetical protein